jgi:hypothetical protein
MPKPATKMVEITLAVQRARKPNTNSGGICSCLCTWYGGGVLHLEWLDEILALHGINLDSVLETLYVRSQQRTLLEGYDPSCLAQSMASLVCDCAIEMRDILYEVAARLPEPE